MKHLLTIRARDITSVGPSVDTKVSRRRSAARAVLFDENGKIYLLNVSKHRFHKLPGGGIDEGESIKQALERELLEEVGCKAEIIDELGTVIEFRNYKEGVLEQTSYCYLARQVGEQMKSALEDSELRQGMYEIKAESIESAINTLEKDDPDTIDGRYIQKRDLRFLHEAKEAILSNNIPKARNLYKGDINVAVIAVQKATGIEINDSWWNAKVGNHGTTEEILDRFDRAYAEFVSSKS